MSQLTDHFSDIYELLDAVKRRPGLWLQTNRKADYFPTLLGFLAGLAWSESDLDQHGQPDFNEFDRWVEGRLHTGSTPWEFIRYQYGNELAFEVFFELLDEYRQCGIVKVLTATINEDTLPDCKRRWKPWRKPIEIAIYQLFPSPVYYFREFFMTEQGVPYEREEIRIYRDLEGIQSDVITQWGIPIDHWIDVTTDLMRIA